MCMYVEYEMWLAIQIMCGLKVYKHVYRTDLNVALHHETETFKSNFEVLKEELHAHTCTRTDTMVVWSHPVIYVQQHTVYTEIKKIKICMGSVHCNFI